MSRAHVTSPDLGYMVLVDPAALRLDRDHIHDISTSIETEVPETATRVIVLYRVSNGFARPTAALARLLEQVLALLVIPKLFADEQKV